MTFRGLAIGKQKGREAYRGNSTDTRKENTGQEREEGNQKGRKRGIWRDCLMSNLIEKRIYL